MAIYDYEQRYAMQMAEFFNQERCICFEAVGFNDRDTLKEYCREHSVRSIVVAKELWEEINEFIYEKEPDCVCILLTQTKEVEIDNQDTQTKEIINSIYKYQSMDQIKVQVLKILEAQKLISLFEGSKGNQKVIGVYSPVGRCLKTSFSIVLGQLISQEKQTLYLNFESFSGFCRIMQKDYEYNLIDFMYLLNSNPEKLVIKLGTMVEKIGTLDYIPPARSGSDLCEISGPDWQRLIRLLCEQTAYEVIILDLTDSVRGLMDLLRTCSKIYMIEKRDGVAMAKLEQFKMVLQEEAEEEIEKKLITCMLPMFREVPDHFEDLPYSSLAEYVKKILAEDII